MSKDDKFSMSRFDQESLRRHSLHLLKNLKQMDSPLFLKVLEQHKILTEFMRQTIQSKSTMMDKADYLLTMLPTRGPGAFKGFIYALMCSGQDSVAKLLSLTLHDQYLRENPESHPIQETQPGSSTQFTNSAGSLEKEQEYSHSFHAQPSESEYKFPGDKDEPMSVSQAPSITHVDPNDPTIRKLLQSQAVYRMCRKSRGRALIINMDRDRNGSTTDMIDLSNLFKSLHFDVVHKNNPTRKELRALIGDEVTDPYHQKADAFVMFVMAHGDLNTITCEDGKGLGIDTGLIEPFQADSCSDLAGKPKMFFIQACQGDKGSGGVQMSCDNNPVCIPMEALSLDEKQSSVHPMEDIIIAYATVPGYKAFRNTQDGSFFVQSLVKVFSDNAHILHLCDMLTQVREKVKQLGLERQQMCDSSRTMQLTRTDDRSGKSLYFFPGYFVH